MSKIVFAQHSGCGNAVRTTPMLKALNEMGHAIIVLCWNRNLSIFSDLPFIKVVLSVNHGGWYSQIMRIFGGQIDHLLVSPVGAIHQYVEDLSMQSLQTHKMHITPPWTKSEIEAHMDFARNLGYNGKTPNPEINISQKIYTDGLRILEQNKIDQYVVINPSFLKTDQWPAKHVGNDKYIELVNALATKYPNMHFIFVGDKQDIANNLRISKEIKTNKLLDISGLELKLSLAVMSKALCCIGNDGGFQYMIDAMGVPTITMYTFTNPVKNCAFMQEAKQIMVPCKERPMCQHDIGRLSKCYTNGCFNIDLLEVIKNVDYFVKPNYKS